MNNNNNIMLRLVVEAVIVGLVVVIMGIPSSAIALKILPVVDDDHVPVMYLSLFITGVSSHLLFETLRINSWYCRNGVACLN
jgi:hypothetical protein